MKLQFHYQIRLLYSSPVTRESWTLRCIPVSSGSQVVEKCHVELSPGKVSGEFDDIFSRRVLWGTVNEPHTSFEAEVSGIVTTGLSTSTEDDGRVPESFYLYETPLTAFGENLRGLLLAMGEVFGSPREMAGRVATFLSSRYPFRKGVTGVATTAEEAVTLNGGVCQDGSHIMLALLRHLGIPCRYCCGLIEGEGESHAWVEVLENGRWYPYEPTRRNADMARYILLSTGRDAMDAPINRGVYFGSCEETMLVKAKVMEVL